MDGSVLAFVRMMVVMIVMMSTGTRMVIVMVMAAAALVIMIVVMAAGAFMVVMMMAAAAPVVMVVVMATAAFLVMMMAMLVGSLRYRMAGAGSGEDHDFTFHRTGQGGQFRDQGIRVLGRQPQLLGGEGDGSFLHIFVGIEFGFHLGSAVGTVQIFDDIYFLFHGDPSCL